MSPDNCFSVGQDLSAVVDILERGLEFEDYGNLQTHVSQDYTDLLSSQI